MTFETCIQACDDLIVARLTDQIKLGIEIGSLPKTQSLVETVQPSSAGLYNVFAGMQTGKNERGEITTVQLNYSVVMFFESLRNVLDGATSEAYSIIPLVQLALSGCTMIDDESEAVVFQTGDVTSNLSTFTNWYIYELAVSTTIGFVPQISLNP